MSYKDNDGYLQFSRKEGGQYHRNGGSPCSGMGGQVRPEYTENNTCKIEMKEFKFYEDENTYSGFLYKYKTSNECP